MASGKGTYITFDGLCNINPPHSDFRFCSKICEWAAQKDIDVHYVDRQDKTYAVRKTSLRSMLESRIRELLTNSRNVVVILSRETRKSGSLLSFEIEEAADICELPFIIVYMDFKSVADPAELSGYWPNSLRRRINNGSIKAIHIPFNKLALQDAISQFTVSNRPQTSLNHYSEYAHRKFKCMPVSMPFGNIRKQPASLEVTQEEADQ